jgi:hypothetical protein
MPKDVIKGIIRVLVFPHQEYILIYLDEGYPGLTLTEARYYGRDREFQYHALRRGDTIEAYASLHGKYMKISGGISLPLLSDAELQQRSEYAASLMPARIVYRESGNESVYTDGALFRDKSLKLDTNTGLSKSSIKKLRL